MNHPPAVSWLLFAGLWCAVTATLLTAAPTTPTEEPVFPESFTTLHNRTARGRIVRTDGSPFAGATVTCSEVFLSGYERRVTDKPLTVTTDVEGYFSFPPDLGFTEDVLDDGMPAYPIGTLYVLEVRPSDREHAFCTVAVIPNHEPASVTLLPAIEPRRFVVETGPQVWVDGEDLPPGHVVELFGASTGFGQVWIPVPSEVLQRRGPLAAGRYRARGGDTRFQGPPIDVGPDSPEAVAFSLPSAPLLFGQVVDGVTGGPLAGAMVIAYGTPRPRKHDLPDIFNAKFWSQVDTMRPGTILDESATNTLIQGQFSDARSARVGPDGAFRLPQLPGSWASSLLVVAPGKLPHLHRLRSRGRHPTPRLGRTLDLGAMPLFPAAVVTFDTRFPDSSGRKDRGIASWSIAEDAEPIDWQHNIEAAESGPREPLFLVGRPEGNTSHRLYVPAGIDFTFRLKFDWSWKTPRIPVPLKLNPGDIEDLGTFQYTKLPLVRVRIIGPDGKPLQGLSIHIKNPDGEWEWFFEWTDAEGELDVPVDLRIGTTIRLKIAEQPPLESEVLPSTNLDGHPPVVLQLTAEQRETILELND